MLRTAVQASHLTMRMAMTGTPEANPKKSICPACGYTNAPDTQFCSQCGSRI